MTHKHCPECDTTQPITDFYKDRTRHDGVQGRCKECSKARYRTAYRRKNPTIQRVTKKRAPWPPSPTSLSSAPTDTLLPSH